MASNSCSTGVIHTTGNVSLWFKPCLRRQVCSFAAANILFLPSREAVLWLQSNSVTLNPPGQGREKAGFAVKMLSLIHI